MMCPVRGLAIGLICVELICGSARAQDDVTVELAFSGPADAQAFLAPTIDELLGPIASVRDGGRVDVLDLRAVVFPPEHPRPALARVWIERGTDRVTIFLVDAAWERILVRHVPAPEGLDEAVREQVAQIVRAAIEALLGGAHIGMTREEAREVLHVEEEPIVEPTPIAAPEVPGTSAPRVEPTGLLATGDASLGYVGQLFADGTVRHAVALSLALRLGDGMVRPVIALGADFWPTSSTLAAGLRLDLRTFILRVEGGVDIEPIPGTVVRACAGAGLDVTAVEPRSIDESTTRIHDAYDALGPVISLRAGVVQRVWEWLGVSASLVLDFDPIDTRYVVGTPDGDVTVIDPWIVRPALWVGASALWR